jgi:hypothetical protein
MQLSQNNFAIRGNPDRIIPNSVAVMRQKLDSTNERKNIFPAKIHGVTGFQASGPLR